VPSKRESEFHLAWVTVSYRSVFLSVIALCVVLAIGVYVVFPAQTKAQIDSVSGLMAGWFSKVGFGGSKPGKQTDLSGPQQAHFTNIDGTVRVKKSNSNTWVNADYSLALDKGDVVQTASEGMAKVVFADGTNYTVKQDSLIVIEENSTNAAQQTQVAVQVTTGTVDLATATYSQGSTSQVIVAGATATLAPETSAQVRNDPRTDQHEILVKKGSGEVTRNGEKVRLAEYEKVSFTAETRQLVKAKELAPPTLITPANMLSIFIGPNSRDVGFSWTPMSSATAYQVRVSRNPYFSSLVFEKKLNKTDFKLSGLGEGAYYWSVQSLDSQGRESVESERNRFTIIPKGAENVNLALELEPFVQHGHVIEVRGKTEVTARVMVNGEEVPVIGRDGSFHFFTPPMPNGENVITITAQNSRGGVNTQQKKIVIQ